LTIKGLVACKKKKKKKSKDLGEKSPWTPPFSLTDGWWFLILRAKQPYCNVTDRPMKSVCSIYSHLFRFLYWLIKMLVRRTGTEEGNAMNNDLERYIYHHAGGGEVGVCVPLSLEFALRLIIVSPLGWEDVDVYDSLHVTDHLLQSHVKSWYPAISIVLFYLFSFYILKTFKFFLFFSLLWNNNFLIFLNYFNTLISKIIFKK